jgi:hypothetical protein
MWTSTQPAESQQNGEPRSDEQPQTIRDLLRHLVGQLSILFRQELSLAKAELSQSLPSLLAGATSIVIAGGLLFAGLLVLLSAAVLGFALIMSAWLAAVLVGGIVLLIGASLLWLGISRFRATNVLPRLSAESLRKDKDVLTHRE